MLLRIRWFIMGAAAAFGAFAYLANELRKARERMTPRNIANTGMRGVADLLDSAAEAVRPGVETR
ncbi:MAG: hypothetical protein QNJ81_11600 [Acidimicrobiia bacterium]|nr:hypothetical protein [Acidimicrobiia bacterium]